MNYELTCGLETHVELATKTKIFCSCANEFGGEPNTHCCPICIGLPGTLPKLNKAVVEYAVMAGLSTHCQISPISKMTARITFTPTCRKPTRFPSTTCRCAKTAMWSFRAAGKSA